MVSVASFQWLAQTALVTVTMASAGALLLTLSIVARYGSRMELNPIPRAAFDIHLLAVIPLWAGAIIVMHHLLHRLSERAPQSSVRTRHICTVGLIAMMVLSLVDLGWDTFNMLWWSMAGAGTL